MFSTMRFGLSQMAQPTNITTIKTPEAPISIGPIQHRDHSTSDVFFRARPKLHKNDDEKREAVRLAQQKFRQERDVYISQLEAAYQHRFNKDPKALKPMPTGKTSLPESDQKLERTEKGKAKNRKAQANFRERRHIYIQRLETELNKPIKANQGNNNEDTSFIQQHSPQGIGQPNGMEPLFNNMFTPLEPGMTHPSDSPQYEEALFNNMFAQSGPDMTDHAYEVALFNSLFPHPETNRVHYPYGAMPEEQYQNPFANLPNTYNMENPLEDIAYPTQATEQLEYYPEFDNQVYSAYEPQFENPMGWAAPALNLLNHFNINPFTYPSVVNETIPLHSHDVNAEFIPHSNGYTIHQGNRMK